MVFTGAIGLNFPKKNKQTINASSTFAGSWENLGLHESKKDGLETLQTGDDPYVDFAIDAGALCLFFLLSPRFELMTCDVRSVCAGPRSPPNESGQHIPAKCNCSGTDHT